MDQSAGACVVNRAGLRKAALVLATLHPEDCSWLIERLRPSWRHDVRRLVDETRTKKVPDRDLVHEAIRASEKVVRPDPPPPDRLLKGLRGLSPSWCARVLAACAPDHIEMVTANRGENEADSIRSELMVLPSVFPPKLAATLADLVRARGEERAPAREAFH
jgi:hypothetical protein